MKEMDSGWLFENPFKTPLESNQLDSLYNLASKVNPNLPSIWSENDSSGSFKVFQTISSLTASSSNENIGGNDSSFSSSSSSNNGSPHYNYERLRNIWLPEETPEHLNWRGLPGIPEEWPRNSLFKSSDDYAFIKNATITNDLLVDFEGCNTRKVSLENHKEGSLFSVPPKRSKGGSSSDVSFVLSNLTSILNSSQSESLGAKGDDEQNCHEENLLTSSKTHFKPIHSDSFDSQGSSQDELPEPTSESCVTICNSKCPNLPQNHETDPESNTLTPPRPISTSFQELAAINGFLPFPEEEEELRSEKKFNQRDESLEEGDKVDEEEEAIIMNRLMPKDLLPDSRAETANITDCGDELEDATEKDYDELCTILNQVLNQGLDLKTDDNEISKINQSQSDWFDEGKDSDETNLIDRSKQRHSWSLYWDTFNPSNDVGEEVKQFQQHLLALQEEAKQDFEEESDDQVFEPSILPQDDISGQPYYPYSNENNLPLGEEYGWVEEDLCHTMPYERDWSGTWGYTEESSAVKEDYSEAHGEEDIENANSLHPNMYSCEYLEQEWRRQDMDPQPLLSMRIKPRSADEKRNVIKKPCSFFLEGNCRRADCRYSHDLSTITCKFWREGFCFKGESCPFRHGAEECQDENMNASATRIEKKIEKDGSKQSFIIDSESDFPSLAACSKSSEPVSVGIGVQDCQSDDHSNDPLKEFRINGAPVVFKLLKKEKKKRKGGPTVNEKVV